MQTATFQLACWTKSRSPSTPHGSARPSRCLKILVKASLMSTNSILLLRRNGRHMRSVHLTIIDKLINIILTLNTPSSRLPCNKSQETDDTVLSINLTYTTYTLNECPQQNHDKTYSQCSDAYPA